MAEKKSSRRKKPVSLLAELKAFEGKSAFTEIYMRAHLLLQLKSVEETSAAYEFSFEGVLPAHALFAGNDEEGRPQFEFSSAPVTDFDLTIDKIITEPSLPVQTPVTCMKDLIILAKSNGFIARLFFDAKRVKEERKRMEEFVKANSQT